MSPVRVLVIDDEAGVRESLRDTLTSLGYDVDAAANGAEGLRLFARGEYDLVITDLFMPGMTGWEVIDELRRRARPRGVILMSGQAAEQDLHQARERGVVVLPKPFTVQALTTAIGRAVGAGRRDFPGAPLEE